MSVCPVEFLHGLLCGAAIVAILLLQVWMFRTKPYDATLVSPDDPDEIIG